MSNVSSLHAVVKPFRPHHSLIFGFFPYEKREESVRLHQTADNRLFIVAYQLGGLRRKSRDKRWPRTRINQVEFDTNVHLPLCCSMGHDAHVCRSTRTGGSGALRRFDRTWAGFDIVFPFQFTIVKRSWSFLFFQLCFSRGLFSSLALSLLFYFTRRQHSLEKH